MKASAHPVTLDEVDEALASLAMLMRAQGEHGLAYLPIFERLEREREAMANLDDRLERAMRRAGGFKARSSRSPKSTSADPRYTRTSAA
ncbi:MAG: hypothetical protein LCH86_07515 [Proteobacteria bacterium]|nr:hypothetical protein [Pseudomonadota bacterium]